jgi:hypothetical protein
VVGVAAALMLVAAPVIVTVAEEQAPAASEEPPKLLVVPARTAVRFAPLICRPRALRVPTMAGMPPVGAPSSIAAGAAKFPFARVKVRQAVGEVPASFHPHNCSSVPALPPVS